MNVGIIHVYDHASKLQFNTNLSLSLSLSLSLYIYIYIYIYVCMYVCTWWKVAEDAEAVEEH